MILPPSVPVAESCPPTYLTDVNESRKTKQRAVNQHHTPCLHLRRFCGETPKNMVWAYDIERGKARPSRVEECGAQKNFYSVQRDDGTFNDELDDWLQGVETNAAAPYEQLLNGVIPQGQARADFSTFVSSLYLRSPAILRAYAEAAGKLAQQTIDFAWRTRKQFEKSMDRFEAEEGAMKVPRDEVWEYFQDKDGYKVQVEHRAAFGVMAASDDIQTILFNRHWYLLEAADGFFITSDSPVQRFTDPQFHYGPMGDGGFMNPAAEVTLPLSPRFGLLITGQAAQSNYVRLGADDVWRMNQQRALGALRFLYASVKDDRISALAEAHKHDGPGVQVSGGPTMVEVEVLRLGRPGRA